MADLYVKGGTPLSGTITPSGNKNAVVSILPATLLTDEPVTLKNVPEITDVEKFVELFERLGSKIEWDRPKGVMKLHNKDISMDAFDGNLPLGMRSAVMLIAPLAYRFKKLKINTKIGGCVLGIRELDTHFRVLESLGAKINLDDERIELEIDGRFTGGDLWADYMSVTTTEQFLIAAVLAKGKSVRMNAASEPHVQDCANFLNTLGAKINGVGSSRLEVEGVDRLGGGEYTIISDHHEIATFIGMGAISGGRVEVKNAIPEHMGLIFNQYRKLGIEVEYDGDTAIVEKDQSFEIVKPYTKNFIPKIEIHPWPYFPTDLGPIAMALATKTDSQILFWNKMYDNANFWVPQLQNFGVKLLMCDPHRVLIWGGLDLNPTVIDAPYIIRAAVAMFMLATSIEGESVIKNADSIRRAHPNFAEKVASLGADVRWKD